MNQTQIPQSQVTEYEVPVLLPAYRSPASVERVQLIRRPDGSSIMRIIIRRDLRVSLERLTFRYRLSSAKIGEPDPLHSFRTCDYTENDLNDHERITFNGMIPAGMNIQGCCAYISSVRLSDGRVFQYEAAQFGNPLPKTAPDGNAPKKRLPDAVSKVIAGASDPAGVKKARRTKLAVILSVIGVVVAAEIVGGVLLSRYLGVSGSVDWLIGEGCYNEAYKIALDSGREDLIQSVCEKASVQLFTDGDLESAYIYASAAPEPFPEMVIEHALSSAVQFPSSEINENALRVAKMTKDDARYNSLISSIVEMYAESNRYAPAIRAAEELRDTAERDRLREEIFNTAIDYYVSKSRFGELLAFVEDLKTVSSFGLTDEKASSAIMASCQARGSSVGALYFANHYGLPADSITVGPEDMAVRSSLDVTYALLTSDQKRTLHARTLAFGSSVVQVKGGTVAGTKITDAVSVDSSEAYTLVLRSNGLVSILDTATFKDVAGAPAYADVVQAAAGENHALFLHANGIVSAYGDNSQGQCDVGEWTDIVAVAAGSGFSVGLKKDGTVVACGANGAGQCDVADYRNVMAIAAGAQTTVMLFEDRTIGVQGYRSFGISDAEKLTGVTRIRAGRSGILAETEDDRYYLFSGLPTGDAGNPYNWRSIRDFDVGLVAIAAVDSSGNLLLDGEAS